MAAHMEDPAGATAASKSLIPKINEFTQIQELFSSDSDSEFLHELMSD